ncbi:MAG: hypothetical protein IGS03_05790 [Candidatus Sericytochromatia bacterium]|nr:hypothetical protein [Candidatus Sericytochromatia bacterium]
MISLLLLMLLGFAFAVIPAPALLSMALLLNISGGVQLQNEARSTSEALSEIVAPQ